MSMNDPLKKIFESQIKALTGFAFQDFIIELFLQKYTASGFTPLRQVKDKGCDGIIRSERRVIACYAPVDHKPKNFSDKVKSDFDAYKKNWGKDYPDWMFITNKDVGPDMEKEIDSLKKGTPLLGVKNIISMIQGLDGYKIRKMGELLRIDKGYFVQDYLEEILDDLLKDSELGDRSVTYSKPLYIEAKIELNYAKEDIEGVSNEFDKVFDYFKRIEELLQGYEGDEITRIKYKIIKDFNRFSGSFKKRLEAQADLYQGKYSNEQDDDYSFFIRAILLYMFEQCLIGSKTEAEKKEREK